MSVKRRRLPNFETCSVTLFATFALYGPLPSRAQAPTPSLPVPQTRPAANNGAIPSNRWTPELLREAFKQADVNQDGQLSRDEAAVSKGLLRRFDQIDTNKDGSISSAEFDEALK